VLKIGAVPRAWFSNAFSWLGGFDQGVGLEYCVVGSRIFPEAWVSDFAWLLLGKAARCAAFWDGELRIPPMQLAKKKEPSIDESIEGFFVRFRLWIHAKTDHTTS